MTININEFAMMIMQNLLSLSLCGLTNLESSVVEFGGGIPSHMTLINN